MQGVRAAPSPPSPSPFPQRGSQLELQPSCSSRDFSAEAAPSSLCPAGMCSLQVFPLLAQQALSQNPPWRCLFACTDLFSNRFCCLVFPQVVLAPFSLRTGSFTTLLLSKSVCLSLCPRQGWASSQAAEILIRGSLILIRGITPQL